jgi:hypothetical protein
MCTEALWMPLFNSMKILIIVFEFAFAMYSLELETKLKKIMISDLPTLFFPHNVSGNTTLVLYGQSIFISLL